MRFIMVFFIAVPLLEMMLLFRVSDEIGGLSTIMLVVLTAVIGVQVLKRQGLSTLIRANARLQSGQIPAQEIVEGMMLAGAGALLLTPGFITDFIGFALLTPPLRRVLAAKAIKSGKFMAMGSAQMGAANNTFWASGSQPGKAAGADDGNIYEGDFSEESESIDAPKSNKDEPND
ncbi:MAG: hypothetical protein COC19_08105 [SAR86 cluster bacterium]|uniref:Biotin--acetyl-CoA-carboxylase ligase n=1 Tax=SAR86 cluster bacterium TaxID=2030880 RepID=A0A2A4MG84_9GAMM|nr:MAG: hypothetical protein COC19_08105 [SAR86 cluster bacterium]